MLEIKLRWDLNPHFLFCKQIQLPLCYSAKFLLVPQGNRTLIIWLTVTCSTIKLAEPYLRRDLNPHTNKSIEDFKSSASTIPPRRYLYFKRTWRDLNPHCLFGNTFQECRINHSATRLFVWKERIEPSSSDFQSDVLPLNYPHWTVWDLNPSFCRERATSLPNRRTVLYNLIPERRVWTFIFSIKN